MHRRELLKSAGALAFAGSSFMRWTDALAAQSGLRHMGKPQPFDYARLKGQARALAGEAYREQVASIPAEVEQLDWDQYQAIRYRPGHSLWAQERTRFQVRFFHLGNQRGQGTNGVKGTNGVRLGILHNGKPTGSGLVYCIIASLR